MDPSLAHTTPDGTEDFLIRQNTVLESIATGAPLHAVLDDIVGMLESQIQGTVGSILLLDADGKRLHVASAKNLPDAYNAAIDGVAIGEGQGSCGTAADRQAPVFVDDIATHPLWQGYSELALRWGLRSCWSTPIFARARDGGARTVLGTFAIYGRDVRSPTPRIIQLMARAEHLACIAIESDRATRALRDSEQRFRTFVDHATDGFFLHATDGTILDVNTRACESLGYTRDELIGKTPCDVDPVMTPESIAELAAALEAGETCVFESRHRRRDGTTFPIELRIRRFSEGGRQYDVALVQDITERKRLEQQFLQAQKMEAVGRLAGGIAHDFNNLLTVINGYASMGLDGLPPDDPLRSRLSAIHTAGERASALTRQLLAFSRKQLLQPMITDVNTLVRNVETLLRRLIGEDIEFVVRLDPASPAVFVDPGQFEQVIMNLAINGRDAMPNGGVLTVETGTTTRTPAEPGSSNSPSRYVRLTVRDTGHGMDDATRARMFEPFFTTKPVGQGTGLGLAVVDGVVRQSGGHVSIASGVGRGTTVTIDVPVADRPPAISEETRGEPQREAAGSETVLLVDDDDGVRSLTRTVLRARGYAVLEASNGEAALRLAERQESPIALLITDVVMPRMSGRELADRLVERHPGLHVLFLSGYTADIVDHHGVKHGEAFLQKPFDTVALMREVRSIIDAGRGRGETESASREKGASRSHPRAATPDT